MQIDRVRRDILRVTAHASELAALVAAARWVASGDEAVGEPSPEARAHVRRVLAAYDRALLGLTRELVEPREVEAST
jgi:hypothetical protein